jgi:signal transduction histidine kinase
VPEVDKLGARARRFSAAQALSAESLSLLAHELRKPIAPLRNATEVLRLICADPLQRHALDIADRQLTQLIRLVEDLVDIAGIRRGGVVLRKQLVDVSAVAEQALETIRPLSDARKQHVQVMLPSEQVLLLCDRPRLIQILENLLDNAVRYTPTGGEITLKVSAAGDHLSIEVSDNGTGITTELLPHIFNLFAQSEQAHPPEGRSGVGLAVVRNLVEIHGGWVGAESGGQGRGSKFVVRLPILKETAEETANAPPSHAFPPRKIY